VESVYCADPGLGQVDPGPGVALQRRHARCRRCVDAVILPPPAGRKLTNPGRGCGWDVDDALVTASSQAGLAAD